MSMMLNNVYRCLLKSNSKFAALFLTALGPDFQNILGKFLSLA